MAAFPSLAHVAVTVHRSRPQPAVVHAVCSAPSLCSTRTPVRSTTSCGCSAARCSASTSTRARPAAAPCDELRPGLDHVRVRLRRTAAELEEWAGKLSSMGISHGGVVDAPYGSGLSFRDPDNIPLEFFAPPGLRRWPGQKPRRRRARLTRSAMRHAHLLGGVAVADRDRVVLERVEVDRDAQRRADLVLAAVALADRLGLVVVAPCSARRAWRTPAWPAA